MQSEDTTSDSKFIPIYLINAMVSAVVCILHVVHAMYKAIYKGRRYKARPDSDCSLFYNDLGSVPCMCCECMYMLLHVQRFECTKGKKEKCMSRYEKSKKQKPPAWRSLIGR